MPDPLRERDRVFDERPGAAGTSGQLRGSGRGMTTHARRTIPPRREPLVPTNDARSERSVEGRGAWAPELCGEGKRGEGAVGAYPLR
jgi:hypothetical protein